MSQTSALKASISAGGKPVSITTLLTSDGFRTDITVPPGCSREFRAMLAACAQSWCKVQNVEHEEAFIHHRWLPEGNTLLLEGSGWKPASRDLLYLSLFLQGGRPGGIPTIVTEDLETPIPPLRLHDLPASVRAAEFAEPLRAES